MRRLLLLFVTLLAFAGALPASSAASPRGLVGFQVLERLDGARASARFPKGRPIQIALWYPSASASPELTYHDYYLLSARETSFSPSTAAADDQALAQFRSFLASVEVKPAEAESLLSTRMGAARGAAPLAGRFPLVLIAQGNGHSLHDQAFLGEFLASRGFAVASVPSQARIGGRMTSEEEIPAQAIDQAADLAFALDVVRREPTVRPGRYGLVGHSFGARAALLLAMRDTDAAALVSLDGGIGAVAGKGIFETTRGFNFETAVTPILHLYEIGDRFLVSDLTPLRALVRSDRWLVRVDDMRHVHFSSMGVLAAGAPSLAAATSGDSSTKDAWDAVAAATASFLQRFVVSPPEGHAARAWTVPASPFLRPAVVLSRR